MSTQLNVDFCQESYVVEKTIEVVVKIGGNPETIRIEALYSLSKGNYHTQAFIIEKHVTIQPTYPQTNNQFDDDPKDVSIWVHYDLPWTDRQSADEVLNQALSFLRERCS